MERKIKKVVNSSKNIWDVIIVGAGPAGTSAAFVLAKAGIRTLILEKKREVGVPNHCGEGVSHNVLDYLDVDENREWIVKRMKGAKVFFPNQGFFYYPERSYCINRTLFDQECTEKSTKAGATLLLNRRVVKIRKAYSSWKLTTQNGEELRSTYLIAADGATSTVRRLLGFREKFTTAIQYKFKPIKRFEEDYFVFYNNEMFPHGYAWVFYRGIETSIGVLGIGNVRKRLEEFIRGFDIKTNQKESVQYGAIPNPMRPMLVVLPGVLFSGDAGGFTFSLTKGGVIGALFSGKAAGEVIRDALIEDNPEILSIYSDRIKLHPSRSRVALFYAHKFLLLNNNSLNAVGEIIDNRLYSEIPVINALCYLSKKPNLETANGFLVGFAAQQILGHYRKYVF